MKLDWIKEADKNNFMNTFGERTPVAFEYGKGIYLYDENDKEYMDLLGGIAVNVLGHAHPKLTKTICEQAKKVIHTSSLYYIEPQAKLARMLCDISVADKVFFGNSGAEANEGAIKLARAYQKKMGKADKFEIITLKNSFHGRTLTTAAATGQEKYQKKFTPLTPGFTYVEMNDIDSLKAAISDKTCAVMLELVQGESGVWPIDKAYLKEVEKLCKENSALLIFDEIQTGIGRTGTMFAYEKYGVEPDIFTLAKALAGGVPIGALCAKDYVASTFEPGDHGSTFGGNFLACASGVCVLSTIISDHLLENAKKVGKYTMDKLYSLASEIDAIKEIRGQGLMIGISLKEEKAISAKNELFEKGFLVGSVKTNTLRILPPLIIDEKAIDSFIVALREVLT